METVILVLEISGTIAFAISGAVVGIKKGLDIFGIVFLGVTTAVGGGIIRDVIIGRIPPTAFVNITFITVAIITAIAVFIIAYHHEAFFNSPKTNSVVNIFDAIGLGVFTVNGMNAVIYGHESYTIVLVVFVGLCTGIGGGMIRDVLVQEVPYVLKEKVYAIACIFGGAVYYLLNDVIMLNSVISMAVGITAIFLARMFATKFRWNLPKIRN